MLTLEEAIEKYKRDEKVYRILAHHNNSSYVPKKIADEYKQLADWLRELQERREAPEIITCGECAYREIRGVDGFCDHITGEEIMVRKTDYCSWVERRTDEMQ